MRLPWSLIKIQEISSHKPDSLSHCVVPQLSILIDTILSINNLVEMNDPNEQGVVVRRSNRIRLRSKSSELASTSQDLSKGEFVYLQ